MFRPSILNMPLDVLINILTLLEASDLRNLMLTCKAMKNIIINEGTLWRSTCRKKFLLMNSKSEQNISSWYIRYKISHNWCKGIYTNKVIIQHRVNYMPWLQFCDSQRLYLSVGSNLRCYMIGKKYLTHAKAMWSQEVPKVNRRDIRTNDISRFIVKDNHIICGNRDGCTAIYEMDDDSKIPHLIHFIKDCHQDGQVEVSAVEKLDDTVVTVSNNSPNVKFWQWTCDENDFSAKQYMNNSQIYCKQVTRLTNEIGCRCLSSNKGEEKLAIGLNGNSKPLLLDVNTNNILIRSTSSRNVMEVVRDIQWHNENCIAFVTHSGKMEIIDARTADVVYKTRDPFLSSLYCIKTDSNRAILVGSSEYARCVLYDTRSTRHVQMYFTQKKSSPVYCLDFDSTKLLAAADRGIASLNFNISTSNVKAQDFSHSFEYVTR